MLQHEELGAEEQEIQVQIGESFVEHISGADELVFRFQKENGATSIAKRPGLVVSVETHTETIVAPEITAVLTPTAIINAVAEVMDMDPDRITAGRTRGFSRTKDTIEARHTAMYLIRQHLGISYPAIGRHFDNRDHTTVMAAESKIKAIAHSRDNSETGNRVRRVIGAVMAQLASGSLVARSQILEILDLSTVTEDGLHLYPTSGLDPKHARALHVAEGEIVLEWGGRAVSNELIHTYGQTALRLLQLDHPVPLSPASSQSLLL